MKMAILMLLLVIPWYGVTYLSVKYEWSSLTYFLTMLAVGVILGYVSARCGYEA